VELSEDLHPQALITFGGKHAKRENEAIDVEEFIGKKGFRAKGKRATAFEVESVKFIEPLQKEEPEDENLPDSSSEGADASASDAPAGEGFAPGSTVEFDEPTLF
jgi:topoisomerase-4 subunit A